MTEIVELVERPQTRNLYMIVGWRQWADAGSVSSGLPEYLIKQTQARRIGTLRPDGFYLFQIPGTHDLVRPVVKFEDGYPVSLDMPQNEFHYMGDDERGVVYFLGDEPHLDIERYTAAILDTAKQLNVKRIIGLGGVYGELPYNKERTISCTYSLLSLREELDELAVDFSDYHGGASIGSYLCRRAGEQGLEYVGLYAFVPTYDFSRFTQAGNGIRIENDFMAWLGVVRRINFMFKMRFDVADLEEKTERLIQVVDTKIDELDQGAPQLGVRDYFNQLAENFTERPFNPLDDVWENEIRRLFDDSDAEESE
jgi:proteasome assembly chaperone (PAC2) family protein